MTTNAYAYLRVSGKGQVDGDGFARQLEAIQAHAKAHDIAIAHVYQEEGVSGTKDKDLRPAFQEMLSAILANGVRTVLVEGLDRLAREYRIQESLLIYLVSKGVTLICARTGEDVTAAIQEDPMKKALVQMQGIFAELEKSMLVKKLKVARERAKSRSPFHKCEGRKGYRELIPDTIAEIAKLRKSGLSIQEIADVLNEEGIKSISGKTFTPNNLSVMLHRQNKSITRRVRHEDWNNQDEGRGTCQDL